jgi:hypothetical protein
MGKLNRTHQILKRVRVYSYILVKFSFGISILIFVGGISVSYHSRRLFNLNVPAVIKPVIEGPHMYITSIIINHTSSRAYDSARALRPDEKLHAPVHVPPSGLLAIPHLLVQGLLQ